MLPPFFSLYRCIFFFIHAIQRQHDPADKGLFCGGKVRCAVVFLGNLADETDAVAVVAGVAFGGFQVWIIFQYIAGSYKLFRCGNILKHILQFLVQCLVILLLQKSLHKEQFSMVFMPEKTDLLGFFFKFKNIIAIAVFDFLLK